MPKKIYKKTDKGMEQVGILPSLTEWDGKVNKSGDTITGKLTVQSGDASGCLQIGADVASNTLTAGTRKLARMTFPTREYGTTKTCSIMSCDNRNSYNYVEFGGHIGDATNTAPDYMCFNVDKTHNSLSPATKECVMAISPTSLKLFSGAVDAGQITSFDSISGKWVFNNANTFKNSSYTYTLPNKTGTIALKGDIPTKVSQLENDSKFTSNIGTITEIKVNGTSKGTSGSVNLTNMVTFASSQTATVAGTSKTTYTYNQPTGDSNTGGSNGSAYFPEGIIMGGTAASAGLVTRGICGVSTPDATTGACTKENLYINYDGDNNYSRKVVLGAGNAGNEIANSSGAYTFSAVRGDQMVSYVTNYVPGAIKTWFDSNVHIPSIKTLNTNNSSTLPVSSSEAISGSGSINLHKVSKTGNFRDLNNRGEAFLSWGGQNFAGAYGPIDAAMISELGANRLAFMKPAGISVEYSRDSGTTWQDYGATDNQKLGLTSTGANFIIGKADSSNKATERYMLRISLHTSEGQVYTQLNKFALYISTSGSNGSYCTIRARTQNNYLNKVDKWVVFANKQSISGWSGWNIINTSTITTFGNTASSQYGEIQFIFGCTSGSTSYVGLQILRLMGFGGVGWTTPSNRAKTGHIYTYDSSQNVTFPAAITSETVNSYNILPRENNIYNLGSPFRKWANIYATTIYENGKKLSETYVKYSAAQSLNDAQKAQARTNIGAGTSSFSGNYADLANRPTLGTAASKNTGTSPDNVPILDSNGKLADSVIPAVAITDTYVVANKSAMLALNAQKGDIAIRSDLSKSFVLQATPASTPENWKELLTPTDAVLSVNGKKGAVTLNLDNIDDGSTRKLADYLPLSGGSVTGALSAAQLSANIIETGTGDNNYFQSRKFRGEGNAATYYHAVDFGFAGHNQVDFYEYGGIWNFWKNIEAAATTDSNNLCLQIGDTYVKNKVNTFKWPTTSGTLALTSNIPEYIVDNLTSTDTDKALSANQGKILKDLVDGKADSRHTHTSINTAFVFNNNDMPEGSANLSTTTNAHQISFYRNGLSVPYQMDNSNDGGILRCRGNSESNVILELATWDDSGDGETIQFNYYPTNSQATPTYSVTVPKKTGTILLTTDSSSAGNAAADKVVARNAAGSIQTEKLAVSSGTTTKATMQYNSTEDCIEFIFA